MEPPKTGNEKSDRQSGRNPIAVGIGIAIVLTAIGIGFFLLIEKIVQAPSDAIERAGKTAVKTGDAAAQKAVDLAKRIWDGCSRRLNLRPEIRIDTEVEIEHDRAVLELATLKRDFTHEYRWEHKWAGSTKEIRLKGYFTATAGFDLNEQFHIRIRPEGMKVDLRFPKPRLLSCEMTRYKAEESDGWWNRLTAEERHQAVNAMVIDAKRSIHANPRLLEEAERTLELQVGTIILQSGGVLGYANDTPFRKDPILKTH